MSFPLVTLLREHFDDTQLHKQATLQRLWSDYGEIARYCSPRLAKTMIVKHVAPPAKVLHPRGWHSDIGHQRKVQSYHKEAIFYQLFAALCDKQCYVPQFISLIQNKEHSEQQTLVLEDLYPIGFTQVYQSVSEMQIKSVLSWLAHFHARFFAIDTSTLWPIGSYWHLATRQAEYQIMPTGALKQSATIIADKLEGAHFRTLIHGDAKLANFCFSTNDDVAAVDFQYVGRGVGVKDVMYFLGSCLSDTLLWEKHNEYVDYYFEVLKNVLLQPSLGNWTAQQIIELEHEWRALIPFAWADFNRFLQGWSAEHVKINDFMQAQTALVLRP
jgi:hypothetical protein